MLFMGLDADWRALLQVVSQLTSPCVMSEAMGTPVKFLFQQLQECKEDKHRHINTPQASFLIVSATIPLARASHLAKLRVKW